MRRVTFVLPHLERHTFSGGTLTVLEYATGLTDLGHDVTVAALSPSSAPDWFGQRAFKLDLPHASPRTIGHGFTSALRRGLGRKPDMNAIRAASTIALRGVWAVLPYSVQAAVQYETARAILASSRSEDVIVATSFTTALPVFAHGQGRPFYFCQHDETLLADQYNDPTLARLDAERSYRLPIRLIANSSWLQTKLQDETPHSEIPLCLNAIDHSVFRPATSSFEAAHPFTVISYGGRGAAWKGFADAAQAVRLARSAIPELCWKVFGPVDVPPSNEIAPYTPLGFVTGEALRHEYITSDVCLAPAWYESFPLYPLEAMASGAALITTPFGVEDYAVGGRNCLVVPPRDPNAMAQAIIQLHNNAILRLGLAAQGVQDAAAFNWTRSVRDMANILGL